MLKSLLARFAALVFALAPIASLAAQYNIPQPTTGSHSQTDLNQNYLNPALLTLRSNFAGNSAPSLPVTWQWWLNTTPVNPTLNMWTGTTWSTIGSFANDGTFTPTGSSSGNYLTKTGDGGQLTNLKAFSNLVYSVKDPVCGGGAKGDGTTDDTPAINACIGLVNTAGGGAVFFPAGKYRVTGTGASVFTIVNSVIKFYGTGESSSLILLDSGIGATTDIFHIVGPTGARHDGYVWEDLGIVPLTAGTPAGRHAFNFDCTYYAGASAAAFGRVDIHRTGIAQLPPMTFPTGAAVKGDIVHVTNPVGAGQQTDGCLVASEFHHNHWAAQTGSADFYFGYAGDSLWIHHNILSGTGYAISAALISGAGNMLVQSNSISASQGILYYTGIAPHFEDNIFETVTQTTGLDNAQIDVIGTDLVGVGSIVYGASITNNQFQNTPNTGKAVKGLRLDNTYGAYVQGNLFTNYDNPIASLTWSGGVATVTTTNPHGVANGDAVAILGATPSGYNVLGVTATVINSTTFTYPLASNPGSSPASSAGHFIDTCVNITGNSQNTVFTPEANGGSSTSPPLFNNCYGVNASGNTSTLRAYAIGFSDAQWTNYTPTVTASGGALGTVTVNTARYYKTGKMVRVFVDVTVPAGTGSGDVLITSPFTMGSATLAAAGYENVSGKAIRVGSPDFTHFGVRFYDATTVLSGTPRILFEGFFESTT